MTTATEHRAIQLLASLYIMCNEAGDFSNGNTHNCADEGEVLAGRFLAEVATFLKGKSAEYDRYATGFVKDGDLPF